MQLGQLLELVDLFSFVVDEHLEEEGLSFLADEIMHGFVDLYPVLYCVFGGFDEAGLGLVAGLLFVLFAELVEFAYGDALLLDALLPDLQFLVLLLLLALPLLLLLFHAEDLFGSTATSASSGMAKGLSYLGTCRLEGILGRTFFLSSSSYWVVFMRSYIIAGVNNWASRSDVLL